MRRKQTSYDLCLLDQDGVIADFMKGVQELFGIPQSAFDLGPRPIPWNWMIEVSGKTEKEFWAAITVDFWANLPWTKDGQEILAIAESQFGRENVIILTHPSGQDSAIAGKKIWFEKHMPDYFKDERYIFAKHKRACANPRHLLIDDGGHNIDAFVKAGGSAVLCPRLWNSLHHVDDSARHIREFLENSMPPAHPQCGRCRVAVP